MKKFYSKGGRSLLIMILGAKISLESKTINGFKFVKTILMASNHHSEN